MRAGRASGLPALVDRAVEPAGDGPDSHSSSSWSSSSFSFSSRATICSASPSPGSSNLSCSAECVVRTPAGCSSLAAMTGNNEAARYRRGTGARKTRSAAARRRRSGAAKAAQVPKRSSCARGDASGLWMHHCDSAAGARVPDFPVQVSQTVPPVQVSQTVPNCTGTGHWTQVPQLPGAHKVPGAGRVAGGP